MTTALKNVYTKDYLATLADALGRSAKTFSQQRFLNAVFDATWQERELKERMRHIVHCMRAHLPGSYREVLAVLLQAAPDFSGFEAMFFPDFVEVYGQDDWEASLQALGQLTAWSSSEFAIRPFILADQERAMAQMESWARDDNYHRRRLASEGCRPRLPWAIALRPFQQDPAPIWPILERLKTDPELYVRRSVANNVNDIAKDHPDQVLERGKAWLGNNADTDRVVKHGCRTLLKAGHPGALSMFGFLEPTGMSVENLRMEPNDIAIGDRCTFLFDILPGPTPPQKMRLEYAIDFVKANGKRSRKVFQISESTYQGKHRAIQRPHDFKQRTTRRHYPGEHQITILINGHEMANFSFLLSP